MANKKLSSCVPISAKYDNEDLMTALEFLIVAIFMILPFLQPWLRTLSQAWHHRTAPAPLHSDESWLQELQDAMLADIPEELAERERSLLTEVQDDEPVKLQILEEIRMGNEDAMLAEIQSGVIEQEFELLAEIELAISQSSDELRNEEVSRSTSLKEDLQRDMLAQIQSGAAERECGLLVEMKHAILQETEEIHQDLDNFKELQEYAHYSAIPLTLSSISNTD